ncbi:hypothetical protein E0Z10_g407 [Xylaria hypoxylon]|uniref:Uncharacterized protein n=1 Tax=Xylaria hypoxylon TaxID=37992 RepID=A0A4Z0YV95_9PEZI|nr:hypothetical protein E0Z10_g407 [Xylaria hypoxylon]
MDDSATLVSELLNKLAELDQKVCDYRQGMAQEFQRYSHRLLQDAPEHVSVRVEKVLADELHNYPALGPLLALDSVSADLGRSAVDRWPRRGRVSPPPVLPHTSGVPPNDITSGSPPDRDRDRDRDREFHGLFTPSFLPLLEVMQPNKTIPGPTAVSSPAPPQDSESNNTQEPFPHVQLDTIARRPDPVRRHTEETESSINSDDSVLRTRRSALRRFSGGSTKDAQSPRRVRFDVEGEEVLPTVSPPTSPRIYDLLTSPSPDDQATPIHEFLNHVVLEEEISILGNSPPRPKKISSTERLKALARSSTEDTSKWTVVGNMHDDDEEEEGLVMFNSKQKSKAPIVELAPTTALKNGTGSHHIQNEGPEDLKNEIHSDQSIGEDEVMDEVPELTPLTSFKHKKRLSHQQQAPKLIIAERPKENSGLQQVLLSKTTSPSSALSLQSHYARDLEEEGFFEFDDDESVLQREARKTTAKYIEEQPEVKEQATPLTANSAEGPPITFYSTSPAIPVAKPASPPPASPVSSVSKQIGASAGSYKGKPFIIGVVRNEELYKKASEMGDLAMFVGSVDGRSGVDASDSYRQDPYCFNGTPRSLGERLMEEAHARRIAGNARKQE